LEDDAGTRAQVGGQRIDAQCLQHHQGLRQMQRMRDTGIGLEVAVQVGSGQHHGEPLLPVPGMPGGDRCG
jgi:hypothetical protein